MMRWTFTPLTVEELDNARVERILGAYHQQSFILNQVLEQLRSVTQMVHRRADVGAHAPRIVTAAITEESNEVRRKLVNIVPSSRF